MSASDRGGGGGGVVCPFATWSKCHGPPQCRRSHSPQLIGALKSRYPRNCVYHYLGRCSEGDNCRYQHTVTQNQWNAQSGGSVSNSRSGSGYGGGGSKYKVVPNKSNIRTFTCDETGGTAATAADHHTNEVGGVFTSAELVELYKSSFGANKLPPPRNTQISNIYSDVVITIGSEEDEKRFPWLVVFRVGLECLTLIDLLKLTFQYLTPTMAGTWWYTGCSTPEARTGKINHIYHSVSWHKPSGGSGTGTAGSGGNSGGTGTGSGGLIATTDRQLTINKQIRYVRLDSSTLLHPMISLPSVVYIDPATPIGDRRLARAAAYTLAYTPHPVPAYPKTLVAEQLKLISLEGPTSFPMDLMDFWDDLSRDLSKFNDFDRPESALAMTAQSPLGGYSVHGGHMLHHYCTYHSALHCPSRPHLHHGGEPISWSTVMTHPKRESIWSQLAPCCILVLPKSHIGLSYIPVSHPLHVPIPPPGTDELIGADKATDTDSTPSPSMPPVPAPFAVGPLSAPNGFIPPRPAFYPYPMMSPPNLSLNAHMYPAMMMTPAPPPPPPPASSDNPFRPQQQSHPPQPQPTPKSKSTTAAAAATATITATATHSTAANGEISAGAGAGASSLSPRITGTPTIADGSSPRPKPTPPPTATEPPSPPPDYQLRMPVSGPVGPVPMPPGMYAPVLHPTYPTYPTYRNMPCYYHHPPLTYPYSYPPAPDPYNNMPAPAYVPPHPFPNTLYPYAYGLAGSDPITTATNLFKWGIPDKPDTGTGNGAGAGAAYKRFYWTVEPPIPIPTPKTISTGTAAAAAATASGSGNGGGAVPTPTSSGSADGVSNKRIRIFYPQHKKFWCVVFD